MAYEYSNNYQQNLGGGGFMNQDGGGSQQEGGAGRIDYDKQTLRPLTIKQILTAQQSNPDAPFVIDNSDVTQVTIVGQIRNIVSVTTKTVYKFDDGTGTIEVNSWPRSANPTTAAFPGDDNGPALHPGIAEGSYARVWGRLKAFNQKRHVVAQFIRPVDEYNEVLYHMLDSTAAHLFFTRGPPADPNNPTTSNNGGAMQIDSGAGGGGAGLPSMSANASAIYKLLAATNVQEGLHANHISQQTGLPYGAVIAAAEELQHTGVVYTTMDDETFALLT